VEWRKDLSVWWFEYVKRVTNLSDSFNMDCIPHFFGYSGEKPLVLLGSILFSILKIRSRSKIDMIALV